MADTELKTGFGSFTVSRYPIEKRETLRAWDAADEYILNHLDSENWVNEGTQVLIFNDSRGALTVSLAESHPTSSSDSYLSQHSIEQNLLANNIPPESVTFIDPFQAIPKQLDLVVIKIPKTLALLEHQLHSIRHCISPRTKIIAAGMVKHIHTSTLNLFTNIIGETKTSLAKKKARLIFSELDDSLTNLSAPPPLTYQLENTDYDITNHANVFSKEKLDIGTRLFIQHIPSVPEAKTIVDLGCGNGIVGIIAAEKNPQAKIMFTDESYMAVASAKDSFMHAESLNNESAFFVGDCLTPIKEGIDLILCNPPFHQDHAVGDMVAWRMFSAAAKALNKGGSIWVVGNRHLGYHTKLAKLFKSVTNIASNKKFVILQATL